MKYATAAIATVAGVLLLFVTFSGPDWASYDGKQVIVVSSPTDVRGEIARIKVHLDGRPKDMRMVNCLVTDDLVPGERVILRCWHVKAPGPRSGPSETFWAEKIAPPPPKIQ